MSTVTYPNGTSLSSTANTPQSFAAIFQPLVAQMLGISTTPPLAPPPAVSPWSAVRMGWAPQGQPAWGINEDVCILTAYPQNDPFSQWRDQLYKNTLTEGVLDQNMSLTQVWRLRHVFYGPNAYQHAEWIATGNWLDWVHDYLAAQNIYLVVKLNRPVYAPENFEGQYWQRADLDLDYNERILETTTAVAAASAKIGIVTDIGVDDTIIVPSGTPWQP